MTDQACDERWDVFDEMMLPHKAALYQTARSLLGSTTEAEDAVQETYLQAWRCLDRFQPGTNSRAWLFGILFNVVRHHRRKWLQRLHLIDDPQAIESTLASQPELSQELADKEILEALATIPRQYAEVVLMADVQEFDYKEIAQARAIPIGTVMSRISRGRTLLRSKLARLASEMGIHRTEIAATA